MVTSKNRGTTGLSFRPCFVLIYLNDIDDVVSNKILKFANDTKLYRVVTNQDDIEVLRYDLVSLCNWSKDWLMLLNIDKCKKLQYRCWKFKWVIQYGRKTL